MMNMTQRAMGFAIVLAALTGCAVEPVEQASPESADAVAYLAVVLFTVTVTVAACLLPARRAGRVDPVESLQRP